MDFVQVDLVLTRSAGERRRLPAGRDVGFPRAAMTVSRGLCTWHPAHADQIRQGALVEDVSPAARHEMVGGAEGEVVAVVGESGGVEELAPYPLDMRPSSFDETVVPPEAFDALLRDLGRPGEVVPSLAQAAERARRRTESRWQASHAAPATSLADASVRRASRGASAGAGRPNVGGHRDLPAGDRQT